VSGSKYWTGAEDQIIHINGSQAGTTPFQSENHSEPACSDSFQAATSERTTSGCIQQHSLGAWLDTQPHTLQSHKQPAARSEFTA
jgi:hypothetical protein